MNIPTFIPIIVIFVGIVTVIKVIYDTTNAKNKRRSRYTYISGQFSEQMEMDMRLPFKRFKELYPENTWSYEQYKLMQKKTAFRRSHSSQDNKRMVR